MATIQEVNELWNNLDFNSIIDESISDNEAEIIDANVDQMRHGLDSNGEMIGQYKNKEYANAKFTQNSLAGQGNVDLILTGDFTSQIILEYSDNFIMPNSQDEKNDTLISMYGERIFGLMPEKLSEINNEFILPSIQKKIHEAVGL